MLPKETDDRLALIAAARLCVAKIWREPDDRPWRFILASQLGTAHAQAPFIECGTPADLYKRIMMNNNE